MAEPAVDLSKFKRTAGTLMASSYGRFTVALELHTIAQLGYGMDPRTVPVSALQLMNTCPAVYFARRTITGIIRRPDLYTVKHDDPKVVAETEAWLWPLLPRLLSGAVAGFDYGSVVCVLDWERRTMRIEVPTSDDPSKKRNKTLVDHTHFAKAYEVHPDETQWELDAAGEIVAAQAGTNRYNADRIAPWIWDPELGEVCGQGAKRRAWRSYCEWLINTLLRDKFLERAVDAPKIAYTPSGKTTVDGVEWEIPDYVVNLLMEVRGAGIVPLPGVREDAGKGERKYAVEKLDVNAGAADTFDEALNRNEADIFIAYLVSPTMSGGLDDVGGAASKTLDGMLREHIEDIACYVASGLTRLVEIVHRANYDPDKVAPPEVAYTDVGKAAARKTMLAVLQLANQAARGEVALRTNMPALLDKMGIPLREPPLDPFDPATDPSAGGAPGPGRDPNGDREGRREDAETESGEEDTGGEDVDEEERTEQPDAVLPLQQPRQASARVRQTYAPDVQRELARARSRRRADGGLVVNLTVEPPPPAQVNVAAPVLEPIVSPPVVVAPNVQVNPQVVARMEAPAPAPVTVVNENHVHVPEQGPQKVIFERRGDDKLTGALITDAGA